MWRAMTWSRQHRRVVPRDRLIPQWVKASTGGCDVLQMARLGVEIKGRKEILDVAVSENTPHDALIGLDFPRCGRLSGDQEDELYPVVTAAVQTRAQKRREAQKEDEESEPNNQLLSENRMVLQVHSGYRRVVLLGNWGPPAILTTYPSSQRSPKGCTAEELEHVQEESDLEPEISNK